MEDKPLVQEQPKSVSSVESMDSKAKSVLLFENLDRFIIQRSVESDEGKSFTLLYRGDMLS